MSPPLPKRVLQLCTSEGELIIAVDGTSGMSKMRLTPQGEEELLDFLIDRLVPPYSLHYPRHLSITGHA